MYSCMKTKSKIHHTIHEQRTGWLLQTSTTTTYFFLSIDQTFKKSKAFTFTFYFPFLYKKKNCSLHFKKWLGLNRATRRHYSFTSFCVYLIIRMTNLTPCYQLRSHQQIHLNIYRHKLMSHLLESILCITVISMRFSKSHLFGQLNN